MKAVDRPERFQKDVGFVCGKTSYEIPVYVDRAGVGIGGEEVSCRARLALVIRRVFVQDKFCFERVFLVQHCDLVVLIPRVQRR